MNHYVSYFKQGLQHYKDLGNRLIDEEQRWKKQWEVIQQESHMTQPQKAEENVDEDDKSTTNSRRGKNSPTPSLAKKGRRNPGKESSADHDRSAIHSQKTTRKQKTEDQQGKKTPSQPSSKPGSARAAGKTAAT